MRLGRSWTWSFTGPAAAWFAGGLFLAAGALLGIAAPAWILGATAAAPPPSTREAVALFRILGLALGGLGGAILALTTAGVLRAPHDPGIHRARYERVGFVGGLLGAALAIPATFALPFLLVIRSREPGELFAGLGRSSGDLWIGGLFSLLGIAVLTLLWLMIRRRSEGGRGRLANREDRGIRAR